MKIALFIFLVILNSTESENLDENNLQDFGGCKTPLKGHGRCIYLNECEKLFNLYQRMPLLKWPNRYKKFLRRSQCGYYKGEVLICCPNEQLERNGGRSPSSELLSDDMKNLPKPDVCESVSTDRIYGGNATQMDEYKWMALLEYTKPGNRKGFHCGGSLLNSRYVITAAHCIVQGSIPRNWELTGVRLGEWDTSTSRDCVAGGDGTEFCSDTPIDVAITKVIVHENYNYKDKHQIDDIALLQLARPVEYTNFIRPICLPPKQVLKYAAAESVVAGWGRTATSFASNKKMKATLGVIPFADCQQIYRKRNKLLKDSQLCAGGVRGIDSCRGDSGGPLFQISTVDRSGKPVDPYYVIAGIVSFGPAPCGLEGWPGVYTKISSYMDWIETNILLASLLA